MALAGCQTGGTLGAASYAALSDGGHEIAAVPPGRVKPAYHRRTVAYSGPYRPGTIVVDPSSRFLYYVLGGGRALRYGVGVGKGAFAWSGTAKLQKIAAWPRWTPPAEMIGRVPSLGRYRGGIEGGALNPLGARALYLYENGRDTLYRIHGTPEWWTIGEEGSSGCIRMFNQDVIDLAGRASIGADVVVLPAGSRVRNNAAG